MRILKEVLENPEGIHSESLRNPLRILKEAFQSFRESVENPLRILKEALENPEGIHSESLRNPLRILQESIENSQGILSVLSNA